MNDPLRIFQVDAFAREPFTGNPAAVCVLNEWPNDPWMQTVAMEMNLSETAFLVATSPGAYKLRWFTPAAEVELCGHATLASAHVLWKELGETSQKLTFETRSGALHAWREQDQIMLDFPSTPATEIADPTTLANAIGIQILFAGKNQMDFLVELANETAVRQLAPDFAKVKSLGQRGVVVTAKADAGKDYDFVSRGFFPSVGIDEDPVTGSAHTMLGPYWTGKLGKAAMLGYQASRRGGYVGVQVHGDRVRLRGSTVSTMWGVLSC